MSTTKLTTLIKFVPPRLTQGQDWYISFYALHPETKKLRRTRIRLNHICPMSQRKIVARQLILDITDKLIKGWNPYVEETTPKAYSHLFEILDLFLKIKEKEMENNSIRTYISFIKILKNWLLEHGYNEDMFVYSFTKSTAVDFMFCVESDEHILPRTYNNYLHFYKLLCNWLIDYGYMNTNPFEKIHKAPKRNTQKRRTTLSEEQRHALQGYLQQHNKPYFVMCMMCYYCFIRPNEISQLRVGDISLKNQIIYVSKEIAKNDL